MRRDCDLAVVQDTRLSATLAAKASHTRRHLLAVHVDGALTLEAVADPEASAGGGHHLRDAAS